jgi:hypothetical protein
VAREIVLGMAEVIGAALGTVGWMVGVLFLVTMAVLPLTEIVDEQRDRRRERAGR